MNSLNDFFLRLLGPDGHPTELAVGQIVIRGLIIFVFGLMLVRFGDRRSLAQKSGFDALFIVLIGSVISRAINGTGPFFKTLAASLALMLIHRLCAFASFRSHVLGKIIKGRNITIVRNGEPDRNAMKSSLVSPHDLEEDLRLSAKVEDLAEIRIARLERSGDISFIKREKS